MQQMKLIIFDLDDTLVDTSHVFWSARQAFVDTLSPKGMTEEGIVELFESIDERNIKLLGFVPERYERTMIDTYEYLIQHGSIQRDVTLENVIRKIGRRIVEVLPELIEGAIGLLSWAKERFNLVLMTRGTEDLQTRKIEFSKLSGYFKTIHIVEKKDVSHFLEVINISGAIPENTWVIGDSIRSDINPAIQAGAKCILYEYKHHSYYWQQEYGVTPIAPFFRIKKLEDAISILDEDNSIKMMSPLEWERAISPNK